MERWRYSYVVEPINYIMFDEARRERELIKWRNFLMSIEDRVRILAINESIELIPSKPHIFKRFYIQSNTDILNILEGHGLTATYGRPSLPRVRSVKGRNLVMDNGLFGTMISVYGYPRNVAGLLSNVILSTGDYVSMIVENVNPNEARKYLNNYIATLRVTIEARQREGRSIDFYMQEYQEAVAAQQLLYSGNNRMHRIALTIGVFSEDIQRLNKRVRDAMDILSGSGLLVDRPLGGNQIALYRDGSPRVYMMTDGLIHLYPFQSADVIEMPGGIYLGINKVNGTPVIVNLDIKPNYNIAIVGKSGSGKSMAIKIFLGRALPNYEDPAVYIIDPETEYLYLRDDGFTVYRLVEGEPLGIDIISALPKTTVIQMLSEMERLTPDQRRELSVAVSKSSNIEEFFENARQRGLDNIVDGLATGAYNWIFTGWTEEVELSNHAVFSLADMGMEAKEYASGIILTYIWRQIDKMDRYRKKIIVVDEAWMFNKGWAAQIIEEISRQGRKRNTTLVTATQFIEDVINEKYLKAAFQNSSIKFIFSHDRGSANALLNLQIPNHLVDEIITGLEPGDCLYMSENKMVWMHWLPTDEEYRRYTTRPTEYEDIYK